MKLVIHDMKNGKVRIFSQASLIFDNCQTLIIVNTNGQTVISRVKIEILFPSYHCFSFSGFIRLDSTKVLKFTFYVLREAIDKLHIQTLIE